MTTACANADPAALLRLLQLVSPALPDRCLRLLARARGRRDRRLDHRRAAPRATGSAVCSIDTLAALDLPLLARLHAAWTRRRRQLGALGAGARFLRRLAHHRWSCSTEDRQLGANLARLLDGLGVAGARRWIASADVTYAAMFALAARAGRSRSHDRAARLRVRLARGADQRGGTPGAARPERRPAHPARARRAHPGRRRARARARRRRPRRRRARARHRQRAPRNPVLAPVSQLTSRHVEHPARS